MLDPISAQTKRLAPVRLCVGAAPFAFQGCGFSLAPLSADPHTGRLAPAAAALRRKTDSDPFTEWCNTWRMDSFRIRRATASDLPFIMATERQPGYQELVGHWNEQHHLDALADSRFAYFLGEIDGAAIGFVIVRDWSSPDRVTLIKRIAVVPPGLGSGRRLLAAVLDEIFRTTDAHRVCLGVFPENMRARRAYQAVGFQAEGVARESAFFDGKYRDELVMSILRHEWNARLHPAMQA